MKKPKSPTLKRLRRNDAGLTLIELTIAAGILSIALGIMFGSLLTLTVMGDIAEGRSRALAGLSGVMEQVRLTGPQVLAQEPAPVVCDGHTMAVMMEVFDPNGIPLLLPLAPDNSGNMPALPDPMEIRVTIMWEGRGGRVYSARSATMIGM